jgi:hypothetical protein
MNVANSGDFDPTKGEFSADANSSIGFAEWNGIGDQLVTSNQITFLPSLHPCGDARQVVVNPIFVED